MFKVVAGLVTYNRVQLLEVAVRAILNQTYPIEQLFVVDNASTDGTPVLLSELQIEFPGRITVLRNITNEGSAGGFYCATRAGIDFGADWTWLLDDDAIPHNDALEQLLKSPVAEHPDTGGLGCFVVDDKGELFPPNIPCLVDRTNFEFTAVDLNEALRLNQPVQAHTNSFDGFLVNYHALKRCGLPELAFFLWYDDIDFALKISAHFKIWVIPSAKIVHKGSVRNIEVKLPCFKGLFQSYEWEGCWRMYYRSRNFYVVLRRYSSRSNYRIKAAKYFVKEVLVPIVTRQENLTQRLRLSVLALWHAYCGQMGLRIELSPPFRKTTNNLASNTVEHSDVVISRMK